VLAGKATGPFEVPVFLRLQSVGRVREGQKVFISLNGAGTVIGGRVSRVEPSPLSLREMQERYGFTKNLDTNPAAVVLCLFPPQPSSTLETDNHDNPFPVKIEVGARRVLPLPAVFR
jgi:hypothetical protein